jgi:septal ring factor EnvC (AmiA/AmiB activator)
MIRERLALGLQAPGFDFWAWLTASVPAGAVLNGGGLLALAVLFARDLIITRGQHDRRMADREQAHTRELEGRDREMAAVLAAHDRELASLRASHDTRTGELRQFHLDLLAQRDERYRVLEESRNGWRDQAVKREAQIAELTDRMAEMSTEAGKLAAVIASAGVQAAGGAE